MWIKIKQISKDFNSEETELERYINLDKVEDIIIKESQIIFVFEGNHYITAIPEDTTNYTEVKAFVETGMPCFR